MSEKYRFLETVYRYHKKYHPTRIEKFHSRVDNATCIIHCNSQIDEEKYKQLLSNADSYNQNNDKSLLDFYQDFTSFVGNEHLNLNFCENLSFLDEYSDNVKNFFHSLIYMNNMYLGIFSDNKEYFISFLKSVSDLIEVYECLDKNSFLIYEYQNLEIEGDDDYDDGKKRKEKIIKYKLKKLSEMSKREGRDVVLNFIFSDDRSVSFNVNSIFLTDSYFNNSFSQDIYNFPLDYEYDEIFLNSIVGYLKGWDIDLNMDQITMQKILEFSDMYCMTDLYNLLIYEYHENNFFLKEIVNEDLYNYVIFRGDKYILDKENYFIGKNELSNSKISFHPLDRKFFAKNGIKFSVNRYYQFLEKNNIVEF